LILHLRDLLGERHAANKIAYTLRCWKGRIEVCVLLRLRL